MGSPVVFLEPCAGEVGLETDTEIDSWRRASPGSKINGERYQNRLFARRRLRHFSGKERRCPSLKSFSNKVGSIFCYCGSLKKYNNLDSEVSSKIIELQRSGTRRMDFKSVDSIILRFPQYREGLGHLRAVFKRFDEDSNGTIDLEGLNKCMEDLQLHLTGVEVEDLFRSCDIDGSQGIQFKEFIVLICIAYLLMRPSSSPTISSTMVSGKIAATFDTIIEAFLFLDKNGDGKLNKKDVVKSLNESFTWERSPAHVTRSRFREIDWSRKGNVNFKDFLFAFVSWVDIDNEEEIPISGSELNTDSN